MCKIIDFCDYKLATAEVLNFFDEIGLDDYDNIDDLFPIEVLKDEDLSFLFNKPQEKIPKLTLIK